ncbi:MAG: TraB/GumN family protein [Ferruginibacter sp.]
MKIFRSLSVLIFLLCFQQVVIAQEATPKTLLWRISGKGLQKPSYLYGTMHLYDRRLFFFGDSVYNSIENTEGFAMELNPADMMDSIFSKYGASDTTSLLKKMMDKNKYDSVAKKLEKRFGMPADKITRKKLIDEQESWYYRSHHKDDMKTIVDLYLYNIAHKQGKWVGGIEDVNDQLGIKDELGKDININDYLDDNDDKARKKYLETMVGIYNNADIEMINVLSSGKSKEYRDILLLNRNIKMARRMDSLSHIRSSFFAVGAAHLPGDSGVIALLKGRGFNVDPVFSSKKIDPDKYSYASIDIPWVQFTDPDSTYNVEMPGKPSNLDILGGEVKFKVYADVVSNNFYMTAYSYASDQTPEEALSRVYKSYTTGGFKKEAEKKITNAAVNGLELVSLREGIYYRMHIFVTGNKYFLCIAGSQKKNDLFSKDFERFFNSFLIMDRVEPKAAGWVDYSNEQKAFAISFPKKPTIDKLEKELAGDHMETYTYTAIDMKTGTYYMMIVSETQKGFVISADSLIFNSKLQAYKDNNSVIEDIKYFEQEANPAMSFTATSKVDGYEIVTKMLVINRGNRSYSIAGIVQKGKEDYPEVTKFFRSFKLMPYKPANWETRLPANKLFSAWLPAPIELDIPDTANLTGDELSTALQEIKSRLQYLSHDGNSATTYNVNVYPLSKYYWALNDSMLYTDQLKRYYTDTSTYFAKANPGKFDSLISKNEILNGSTKGYEILVKDGGGNSYKKVRVFLHGDSVYHLFMLTNPSLINNENNSKFFNGFRFTNEQPASLAFTNKTAVILADLQNTDSITRSDAIEALNKTKFTSKDLPLLYVAYFKDYPVDSTAYNTINKNIGQAIKETKDSSILDFVKDNYAKLPVSMPELKMDILGMLASLKSDKAFALVKELLLTEVPSVGPPYGLIYALADTLLLCKELFPALTKLYGDSILGSGMIRLASEMIDSSLLTKDALVLNTEGILRTANLQLRQMEKDPDDYPDYNYYVIDALGKLNDNTGNAFLYEFLKTSDLSRKENAVLALLKNEKPVPGKEIQKLASDLGIRIDFYNSLKKNGKTGLFPKEFLNQKKFAEGYIYNYVSDDDYGNKITLKQVAEKVMDEHSEKVRYYIFKYTSVYEEETNSYLAICGPFDMNKEKPELKNETDGIKVFFDEAYEAKKVDSNFDLFMKEKENNVTK